MLKNELHKAAGDMTEETKRVKQRIYTEMQKPKRKTSKRPQRLMAFVAIVCLCIVSFLAYNGWQDQQQVAEEKQALIDEAEAMFSPVYFEYAIKRLQYGGAMFSRKEQLQQFVLEELLRMYSVKRFMHEQGIDIPNDRLADGEERFDREYAVASESFGEKFTFTKSQYAHLRQVQSEYTVGMNYLYELMNEGKVDVPLEDGEYVIDYFLRVYKEDVAQQLEVFKATHFYGDETVTYKRYDGKTDVLFAYNSVPQLQLYTNAAGEFVFLNPDETMFYVLDRYPIVSSLIETPPHETEMVHEPFSASNYRETKEILKKMAASNDEQARQLLSIFDVLENSFADDSYTQK